MFRLPPNSRALSVLVLPILLFLLSLPLAFPAGAQSVSKGAIQVGPYTGTGGASGCANGDTSVWNGSGWDCAALPVSASLVTSTAVGGVSATDVQSAISELDSEKLAIGDSLSAQSVVRTDVGPSYFFRVFNEANTTTGFDGWIWGGSGASFAMVAATDRHFGIVRSTTGTGTTDVAYIVYNTAVRQLLLGQGTTTFEAVVNLANLSDGTNTYGFTCGLFDTATGLPGSGYGLGILHDSSTPYWRIIARQSNTSTVTNSTVTVTAAAWHRLTIVINAAGTSAQYFVDGTEVSGSPLTTNLPATNYALGMGCVLLKSAGSSARVFDTDYVGLTVPLTVPR